VNIIATLPGEYDLVSDRYVVDAKSIMGIFSLDLSAPLRLDARDPSELENLKEKLKKFIV
jgi:hypothetical protein